MSDSNIIPGRPPGYPVSFDVQRQLTGRNRATTAFRLILAVPQLIIVGGGAFALRRYGTGAGIGGGGLSSAATAMTIVAWFGIVFASRHPRGLWDFAAYYMRWRVRVGAYVALFRDDYPPFGDEPYPTTFESTYPADAARDRLSVGLRLLRSSCGGSRAPGRTHPSSPAKLPWHPAGHRGRPRPPRDRAGSRDSPGGLRR